MAIFSKYRHILGVEKEGVHRARVGPFALNDLIGTLLLAILSGIIAKNTRMIPLYFFIWWLIGEFMHLLFGVQTNVTKAISK